MTEAEFKLEARLRALEWAVAQVAVTIMNHYASDPTASLAAMKTNLVTAAQRQTFPELADAAKSDLMSAEFEAAVSRLCEMQLQLAAELGKLRGRP